MHDGTAAVAIGIAAELSIKEGRLVHMSEIVGEAVEQGAFKRHKCE